MKFSGQDYLVSANEGFINDPHKNFQKSRNGLNDHKGPENINYTIVKYGEMFYACHTALTPVMVKINRFKKK